MAEWGNTELDGPRWGPASGSAAKQLVVLCHGLGADGNDLIDLAPYWSRAVPDAVFVAPHAPEPFAMTPHGRQWFPIDNLDPATMGAGVRLARVALDRFLDAELARLDLPADAYALMGFSQGAMTALFTGLRRQVAPRAILAFSGALIEPESLPKEITARPPVLLVHGEEDPVVTVSRSREAETVLRANGVPVQGLYVPKLEHGIEDAGLSAGALWLQKGFATGVELS
ncbi:MAG: phospholipase [Acidiphilium sp.]|nr:phospholipase [Acidiphilium sp.]MDD4935512.1 phospholipase [Acidiphilium sp.]